MIVLRSLMISGCTIWWLCFELLKGWHKWPQFKSWESEEIIADKNIMKEGERETLCLICVGTRGDSVPLLCCLKFEKERKNTFFILWWSILWPQSTVMSLLCPPQIKQTSYTRIIFTTFISWCHQFFFLFIFCWSQLNHHLSWTWLT